MFHPHGSTEIAGLMIRAYQPLVSFNKAGYETLISVGGTLEGSVSTKYTQV